MADGEVYYRENSVMTPVELSGDAKERVKGMVELRGLVNELIAYQLEDFPDADIAAKQAELNAAYDAFTAMSFSRIDRIIASLKDYSYRPKPARRTYIAKKNNPAKKRPLGIPSGDDKLVQEVVRMILESIYEPTFSEASHGFRPKRSCHTALLKVQKTFTGAKWFVEGDIKGCFDNFDHHVLIGILRKRIEDEAFINLMWKFLKAGYMEQWQYHMTYSGTPQGSGMSPILANIYLNELDRYMDEYKARFHSPTRTVNPAHRNMATRIFHYTMQSQETCLHSTISPV